ncbi:MAG: RNA polymerase sigma factor [Acidimicrobiia bacterium]
MSIGESFPSVLEAAQARAPWAWSILYRDLAGPVLGYLRSGGAADPENLVGEVFLQLARNLPTFTGDESAFRAWVFTVARHRLLNERRSRSRRPTVDAEGSYLERHGGTGDVEEEAMVSLTTREVEVLLSLLTSEQREVLMMRLLGGLTVEEVARAIGRREGAVKALQRRGLANLRREIERRAVPL